MKTQENIAPKNSAWEMLTNDAEKARMTDVNDNLKRESADLQKAHDELTRILSSLNEAFFSFNTTSFQYTFISPACEKIYGYSAKEFVENPMLWKEVIHPDDEVRGDMNDERLKRGEQINLQYRIIHKNKSIRWVDAKVIPTVESGRLIRIEILINDITDRKKSERALRQSERNLREFFESAPDAISIIDMETGLFVDCNAKTLKMFKCSRKEFTQKGPVDISPPIQPDGIDSQTKATEFLGRAMAGEKVQFEWLHSDSTGRSFYCEVHLTRLSIPGCNYMRGSMVDISDKKLAEQKLEKANLELNNLFNTIDEVVYSVDTMNGKVTHMSPACIKIYGYTPEDFYADAELWYKMTHPDDLEEVSALYPVLMAGEKMAGQCRIINRSNQVRWVEYSTVPTLNKEGFLVRIDGVTRDITDKKLAEENLEKANRELSKLFNSIDEVLFSMDLVNFKFIQMSPACETVLGYPPSAFFDSPNLWREIIHLEDTAFIDQNQPLLESGKTVCSKYRVKHKDQSWHWIESTVTPTLDENGVLIRMDGVTKNIDERKIAEETLKESEERYRLICENPLLGVGWLSPDGTVLNVNETIATMLGYTVDELLGSASGKLSHPDDMERDRSAIEKLLAGEVDSFKREKRYITKSKDIFWAEANFNSIKDDQGAVKYVIVMLQDISARKQAEMELLALNMSLETKVKDRTAELETSNKELEAFGYSISHDLRAPLRVINGYGKMLKSDCADKLNEEEHESLEAIITNAQRMGNLIDDLLNFSRLGRASLLKKEVNMNDLARAVVKELGGLNLAAEITIGDLPWCECDHQLTKQVWINLISNAIKYSGKNARPLIEIGSVLKDGLTAYYVKDNGIGFDMKYADKLFGVFQRLHKVTDYEGTGVGLALSHRIVTRQGGKIWAEAKLNKGATFYFTFPASQNLN
ncbi:MAG: hypothetical protein JWO06_366 [Bacteroidota bacterium]|nr:hypothetical protein [Bacteroidota bacterium]